MIDLIKKMKHSQRIGLFIIILFCFIAIFASFLAPYNPDEMFESYEKPSPTHLLGTNDLGQDILSELIFGTRVSLFIGFFTAFIVTFVGSFFALIAAYYGGKTEKILDFITNVAMAIPGLPLTILLAAFMTPGKWNIIIAISITAWTGTARILKTKIKQIRELPFIKIEESIGMPPIYIMVKHIIPNILNLVLVRQTMAISSAMITESSLSFLGLGTYGEKSWGSILRYAFFRNSIVKGQVWWYFPPIICISVVTLGFMLLASFEVK